MKKVLLGLMVIFMIGSSVKTTEAQICWLEPVVTWDDNCEVGYVNLHYKITYTIYEICDQPGGSPIFDHTNYEVLPATDTKFCILNQLCDINELEPCYRVVVSIEKIDGQPSNPGDLICRNYKIVEVNCEDLMNLSVHIVLN